ncbi:MAG: hypothetical protein OXC30_05310 [Alphaproteobacteria bacterium]|nr:hypothetical protein [Alphaproteobacteria bacterium]
MPLPEYRSSPPSEAPADVLDQGSAQRKVKAVGQNCQSTSKKIASEELETGLSKHRWKYHAFKEKRIGDAGASGDASKVRCGDMGTACW